MISKKGPYSDNVDDAPPTYSSLPKEFIKAGISENQLEILRDYDTVIIVDDSLSMEFLWGQVSDILSSLLTDSTPDSLRLLP